VLRRCLNRKIGGFFAFEDAIDVAGCAAGLWRMQMPQKVTFGEMRASGARGLIVFCSDYRCSHNITLPPAVADQWPDDLRLSDLEPRFVCQVCGRRGANISGDFHWDKPGGLTRGY
jgi:hypothetical protein